MSFLFKFILVTVGYFLFDLFYVFYTRRVVEGRGYRAGAWASSMALISSIMVLIWVHEPRLIPAAMLGSFIGTVMAVRLDRPPKLRPLPIPQRIYDELPPDEDDQ